MLSDTKSNRTRFTKTEFENLRKRAARNGYRIVQVKTHEEAMVALMKTLPRGIIDDMIEFFETGVSPLTTCPTLKEFEERLSESTAGRRS